jgi:uncharacterized membrane protein YedE/YeeE
MKRVVFAAIAGVLFGLGLAVSGMTNPDKVLNFLDVAGQWDPSLALVMGGALAITAPGYAWMRRRGASLSGDALPGTPSTKIDRPLLVGSALFGIGWGIAGYCPGPALANFAHGTLEAVVFVAALLAGSQLARRIQA